MIKAKVKLADLFQYNNMEMFYVSQIDQEDKLQILTLSCLNGISEGRKLIRTSESIELSPAWKHIPVKH